MDQKYILFNARQNSEKSDTTVYSSVFLILVPLKFSCGSKYTFSYLFIDRIKKLPFLCEGVTGLRTERPCTTVPQHAGAQRAGVQHTNAKWGAQRPGRSARLPLRAWTQRAVGLMRLETCQDIELSCVRILCKFNSFQLNSIQICF